jgi:hypothetical protein
VFRRFRETPVQDPGGEVRAPDPYVWRLPTPYDARWRRWHKRSRAAGRYLPYPEDGTNRPQPERARPPALPADDVVRPYVLRP